MKLKVIKSEAEYQKAMKRLEKIFDAPVNTPEGDEAEIIAILIDKYEQENFPIEAPDPIAAIKFRMEQLNLKQSDVARIIGYRSRVSEIFSKKRKLTLPMIKNLHNVLNIPYEVLF